MHNKHREQQLMDDFFDNPEQMKKAWESIPYNVRLLSTMYVFYHLLQHMAEGGTFRKLIYDRLGFDCDAYCPLLLSGGQVLSNIACVLEENNLLDDILF